MDLNLELQIATRYNCYFYAIILHKAICLYYINSTDKNMGLEVERRLKNKRLLNFCYAGCRKHTKIDLLKVAHKICK